MRCICDDCARTMIMVEKGLGSHCVCPECLRTCAACMGHERPISRVLSADELRERDIEKN